MIISTRIAGRLVCMLVGSGDDDGGGLQPFRSEKTEQLSVLVTAIMVAKLR